MAKPVIAVDIDEVLVPTDWYLAKHLASQYGVEARPYGVRTLKLVPEFMELTGRSEYEIAAVLQKYLLSSEYDNVPPIEGAELALARLAEVYEIVTITARSPEFQEPTRVWVQRHFADLISSMYFPNIYPITDQILHVDKNIVLRETGATWLIDDSPDHFNMLPEDGIRGILFGDYPWNQGASMPIGIERAHDWSEVEHILLAKGD